MNRPLNRMTSVYRKSHMPKRAPVSSRCSILISDHSVKVIGTCGYDRIVLTEVFQRRWRRDCPLEGSSAPGIIADQHPFADPLPEIRKHDDQAGGEHPGTQSGYQVERLELGQVVVVTT